VGVVGGTFTAVSVSRRGRALGRGRRHAPALRPGPTTAPPGYPVTPGAPPGTKAPARPASSGPGTGVVERPSVGVGPAEPAVAAEPVVEVGPLPEVVEKARFRDRLSKARSQLAGQLAGMRGRGKLDQQAWDDLEEALILADIGVETTQSLLVALQQQARLDSFNNPDQLVGALRQQLAARLQGERQLHMAEEGATTVWLFVGVNGVGKTTTIGKLGLHQQASGRRVVMAAGDTFRAAAADQLQVWAERVGAGFVRGNEGGDPGAVVFDAVQHAAARGADLVLADTAGRLHTKVNLMEELKKVRRVADRPPGQVTEVLLVIDATTGQNGLVQARQFTAAVGVTGVVLTKLDGTAKGGIAVAIADELGIPIKLVGLGEGAEDLVAFDAQEFVDALLPAD
jgi:fused signal recognition particle receptor